MMYPAFPHRLATDLRWSRNFYQNKMSQAPRTVLCFSPISVISISPPVYPAHAGGL